MSWKTKSDHVIHGHKATFGISMHSFTQTCIPWVVIWVTKSFHRQIIGTNQLWQRLCKAQKLLQDIVVFSFSLASPDSEKNWKVSQC